MGSSYPGPVTYNPPMTRDPRQQRLQEPSGSAPAGGETAALEGVVRRILFTNEENGWAAVRLETDDGDRFTAVGTLLGVREGDRLRLSGRWKRHEKFGRQLDVASFVHVAPTTRKGLEAFLASGRLPGIGPALAKRLVGAFGLDTLEVLDREPERLTEVPGIGPRTAEKVVRAWQDARTIRQVMVFLLSHGISPGVAAKVHRRYGASALDVVRENPYRLADEVFGVGFATADRIARSLGIPRDAPQRLEAGLVYALQEAAGDGHVFLPRDRLLEQAASLLEVDPEALEEPLDELERRMRVVVERPPEPPAIFLPRLHAAEVEVARQVRLILESPAPAVTDRGEHAIRWFERRSGLTLAEAQRRALAAVVTEKALVVTGGPGTGKTTLVQGVTAIFGAKGRQVELAAPTGRAAKRLAEATGLPARTIHRLLEFNPATRAFARSRENPIQAELLVVDEVSMLDVELAAALFAAVPPACRVLLVGDADQLPSVGPGSVLADLIASGALPVVRLEHIFRQAAASRIVLNAHRVNHGRMPELPRPGEDSDFFFVERDDPAALARTVGELVAERIPRSFGLDPVDDVHVLAPMHRGEAGVAALNTLLRARLNPGGGPELIVGSRSFRAGDKVMQIRNNYELEVFNGDLGRVVSVDPAERTLIVLFDGRPVQVPTEGLDDLVPAYCSTIHKAQGSEFPAVVIALHHSHHIMLERNLLYTAITRGKRLVVVVGSRRALQRAVSNATQRRRHTRLAERLANPRR